jgi:hypothetical protein
MIFLDRNVVDTQGVREICFGFMYLAKLNSNLDQKQKCCVRDAYFNPKLRWHWCLCFGQDCHIYSACYGRNVSQNFLAAAGSASNEASIFHTESGQVCCNLLVQIASVRSSFLHMPLSNRFGDPLFL